MKILVTGGAGFIGSNFIHYWLKKYPDDEITNLDKLTYCGNLANLKDIEKNKNYKFVKGDICDKKLVDELVKDIDTIIHFAAESHVDRSIQGYAHEFTQTNVIGTQVLLEAAVKHGGKRFHHISTDEVYGALPLDTEEKFNEKTQFKPNSPYSASKAASDHLVRAYHKSFDLPVTITNTSNNYGPFQYPEKLLPVAITNLLKGKKVPIYGDGLYVRDWLYVIDHCRAIDLVLEKGKIGETYCIGGMTEDISNLDLIRQILKVMNKKEKDCLEYIKDRPGHDRRYAVDWSKAKNQLGYEPKYSLKENLEKTINWYQNNQDWWQKILSGEHFKQWQEKHYQKR